MSQPHNVKAPEPDTLNRALMHTINRFSVDAACATPDYVLADMLENILKAFRNAKVTVHRVGDADVQDIPLTDIERSFIGRNK